MGRTNFNDRNLFSPEVLLSFSSVTRARPFLPADAVVQPAGQVTVLIGRSNKTVQHANKKHEKKEF